MASSLTGLLRWARLNPIKSVVLTIGGATTFLASLAGIWAVFTRQTVPEVLGPIIAALALPPFYPVGLIVLAALVIGSQWVVIVAFASHRKALRHAATRGMKRTGFVGERVM